MFGIELTSFLFSHNYNMPFADWWRLVITLSGLLTSSILRYASGSDRYLIQDRLITA